MNNIELGVLIVLGAILAVIFFIVPVVQISKDISAKAKKNAAEKAAAAKKAKEEAERRAYEAERRAYEAAHKAQWEAEARARAEAERRAAEAARQAMIERGYYYDEIDVDDEQALERRRRNNPSYGDVVTGRFDPATGRWSEDRSDYTMTKTVKVRVDENGNDITPDDEAFWDLGDIPAGAAEDEE